MHTLRLSFNKNDMEKIMITFGMAMMEVFGIVLLFCGIFDIKIF